MGKRDGLLKAIGRRVLTGALSVAMTTALSPLPARATVAPAQDEGQGPDGLGKAEGDGEDAQGDEQASGDEGDARTSKPVLRRVSLGTDMLFELRQDGTADEHPELTLSGQGRLSVEAGDADGDLVCAGAEDGAGSRVEVRGPGEDEPTRYPLRRQDGGTSYVPDTESGAIDLTRSGDYAITVVLTDGDPEHDLTYSREVTVDLEAPQASVTWGAEEPGEPGGSVFAARTATVEVSDDLLLAGDPEVRAAGGSLSLSGWERSEDGRRARATVSLGEGTYSSLVVSASDGVHDTAFEAVDGTRFVVDRTAPAVAAVEAVGSRGVTGGEPATLDPRDLSASDPAYLRQGMVRVRVDEERPAGLEVSVEGGGMLPVTDEGGGTYAFELPEGACPRLSVVARDEAGNTSAPATIAAGALVVDGTAPTIEAVTTSAPGSPDLPAHGARLGIGASTLTVRASDANLAADAGALVAEAVGADGELVRIVPSLVGQGEGTATFSLALPDGTYPSLTLRVTDRAGNEASLSFADVLVDTVAPAVSVTQVTDGLRQGLSWDDEDYGYLLRERASGELVPHLRRPGRSVVTVEEGNLCEAESRLQVDGGAWVPFPDGERVRWGDSQDVSEDVTIVWAHAGGRHTCVVTYDDVGRLGARHLTPLVRVCDEAGNVSCAGEPRQAFVVDTAAPVIEVAWGSEASDDPEPRNVSGGRAYYDAPRAATVTLSDGNWDLTQAMRDVVHVVDADAGERPGSDFSLEPGEDAAASQGASYVATFRDGDYDLWAEGHDLAGNHTEVRDVPSFVVDTTRPVIGVSFDGGEALNGRYFDGPRTMTVSVTERNFDPSRIQVRVVTEGSDHDGDPSGDVNDPSQWVDEGDLHTFTYRFGRDGAYTVEVTGSDLATNEAEPVRVDEFVIDQTAPEVSVRALRPQDSTLDGTGYYRQPVAWDVTIRDRNLDVSGQGRTAATITCGNAKVGPVSGWERTRDGDGVVTWHTTVLFDELGTDDEGRASLTPEVLACDLAGNAAGEPSRPFYVDRTAPSIVRAAVSRDPVSTGEGEGYQFFNQPTSMTLAFHDPYGLMSASLDDPDGEYVMRGAVVPGSPDGTLTVELVDGTRRTHDTEYERDITLTVADVAGNVRVWTIDRQGNVVDDRGSSADNLSLGGRGVYPLSLVEDVTAPRVALTGPEPGAYYASGQAFHLAVDEFNLAYLRRFDPSRPVVRVTRADASQGRAESSWDIPVSALAGAGSAWELDQTLEEEGHYTLTASLTDFADNRSNEVVIGEFTIDRTAPVVTVAWDNEDVRNGSYYDRPRTATVTVVEHDFDPARISLDTTGSVGGWTGEGDTHTCLVSFGEGVHHLAVGGSDLAGNASEVVSEPEFVVDTTPPTVEIGGVAERAGESGGTLEDHGAYNGAVQPQVVFADEANLDEGSVRLTLTGGRGGEASGLFAHGTSSGDNREVVLFSDLGRQGDGSYDVGVDDVYVLHADVADLAGNTAEAEVTFSVNRFGSNFIVSVDGRDVTSGAGALLTEPPTVLVREVNVSGAASEGAQAVLKEYANLTTPIARDDGDGPTGYRLEEVPDQEGSGRKGWAEYLYTIRSGNFGEGSDSDAGDGGQGVYRVNVVSDDAASNANSTADFWASDEERSSVRQGQGTAQFTLDELGPVIDGIVVPQGPAVGGSFEASLHVTDAITTGDEVEVTVDGERVEVTGPSDGRGTFTFVIPARSFALREVRVAVRDYAGRTADSEATGLYVTDLRGEAAVACVAAAALVGAWLAVRHGRRRGSSRGGE